jgi:hypothetical protein
MFRLSASARSGTIQKIGTRTSTDHSEEGVDAGVCEPAAPVHQLLRSSVTASSEKPGGDQDQQHGGSRAAGKVEW